MNSLLPPSPPTPQDPTLQQGFFTPMIQYDMPVGSVISFAGKITGDANGGDDDPGNSTDLQRFNWKLCDGSQLHRDEFPELFAALGYLYGGEKEVFNLPDLRGMFLRGVGSKDDKAANEERKSLSGKNSNYSGVGSVQSFAMQEHQHKYFKPVGASPGKSGAALASTTETLTSNPTDQKNNVKTSQYETRPVNVYVHFLIKCRTNPVTANEHSNA